MGDLAQWFNSLPPMTRTWFGGTIALSLIQRLGFMSMEVLVLDYYDLVHRFQIWRLVSCVFFYPMTGFHFLIMLYFLYSYSLRLETDHFVRKPADYLFMLLFTWLCCVLVALFRSMPLLLDSMVMSVIYVWCQLNKDTVVSFWFGTRFKAMYLPWVILAFNMILGGSGASELIGIIVGHLYFFLTIKYPQDFGGAALLHTPQMLYDFFPNQQGVSGFGQAPAAPRAPAAGGGGGGGRGGGGLFRGQGHTLR